MNRKNITALAARLELLGFGEPVTGRLAAYCCFEPESFEISYQMSNEDGKCLFQVHCAKGELNLYDALYFTATLRKNPAVCAALESLHGEMSLIDWLGLFYAREDHTLLAETELQAEKAANILQQLKSQDDAGLLRFLHWAGTPLEPMVPNIAVLRSQHEITQRFYLLADQPPISFHDAKRFLVSRWMERKISADKKLLVKNKDNPTAGAGGKLLSKRVRAKKKTGFSDR